MFCICFLPLTILFPIRKVGKKKMKTLNGKNYIVACNHMSNMDPFMMDIKMGKKYIMLAKKEIFKNKFIGAVMRSWGAVPVDRGAVDTTAIKTIFKTLDKGKNVCIFPQGTRTKTPQITNGEAKEGVAMFSIRTGTPVVPMMYSRKIKIFRPVKLYIGEPIFPDESRRKDKEYIKEFSDLIVSKMNELLEGETKK